MSRGDEVHGSIASQFKSHEIDEEQGLQQQHQHRHHHHSKNVNNANNASNNGVVSNHSSNDDLQFSDSSSSEQSEDSDNVSEFYDNHSSEMTPLVSEMRDGWESAMSEPTLPSPNATPKNGNRSKDMLLNPETPTPFASYGTTHDSSSQSSSLKASTTSMSATTGSNSVKRSPPTRNQSDDFSISSLSTIASVAALPGMVIRSHSITAGKRRGDLVCNIRPSSTKVALKAVHSERKVLIKRQRLIENGSVNVGRVEGTMLADGDGHASPTAATSIPSPLLAKESYWIDIEIPTFPNAHNSRNPNTPNLTPSTEELYEFLKQLRLPPFFLSLLSEPAHWSSEVVPLKHVSLAIFQVLPLDPESDEITRVALLSMPRLLVTFSTSALIANSTKPSNATNTPTALYAPQTPQPSQPTHVNQSLYPYLSQYMKQKGRLPCPTSTGALVAYMQYHVQRTSRAIRQLRIAALEMDRALDRDFARFDFEDLVEVKNCLLRVLGVSEEQVGVVEALLGVADGRNGSDGSHGEVCRRGEGINGLDFSNCKGSLSVLLATATSNERLSSRVDKHLNELRERIMAHREDSLNQRLGLLTILSSIFMPLTLMSGIWGMNFENMPELGMAGAYQLVLLGMFLLALCMVYSFRSAGW